jgi:endoribonuclease LACTB2
MPGTTNVWEWNAPPIAIERIEIPNTHFMRGQPTNCYVFGNDSLIIVDPGDVQGAEIVLETLGQRSSQKVQAIFLTHAHPDHAPAAIELRRQLHAPVLLHADSEPIFREHFTWDSVDMLIDTSRPLQVGDEQFEQVLTPGHAPGHVALFHRASGTMIAGDLVSGNGTIGVFPPYGSMSQYIDSLKRARDLNPRFLLPGHGPVIDDPASLFQHYLQRRAEREAGILKLVRGGSRSIEKLRAVLYPDLDPELSYAADSTIRAHLIKLYEEGLVRPGSDDVMTADWNPA